MRLNDVSWLGVFTVDDWINSWRTEGQAIRARLELRLRTKCEQCFQEYHREPAKDVLSQAIEWLQVKMDADHTGHELRQAKRHLA